MTTEIQAPEGGDAPLVVKTAPARIWLQVSDDAEHNGQPFPASTNGDEVTWCQDQVLACEVEYIRADLAAHKAQAPGEVDTPILARIAEYAENLERDGVDASEVRRLLMTLKVRGLLMTLNAEIDAQPQARVALTAAQVDRLYANVPPSAQQDARSREAFRRLVRVVEAALGIPAPQTKEPTNDR